MADRDVNIRISLKKGPFKDGLKEAERDVQSFGERARSSISKGFGDGIKGAQGAVTGLFSSIKQGLVQVSGIGGLLGVTELVRGAMKTREAFKDIAVAIQAGSGDAKAFAAVMFAGSSAAVKWGKDVDELGAAMKAVWQETGDKEFTTKSAETIAKMSRATGESMGMLGSLAGGLHKHFGIADKDLEDTMASVISLGNKGGTSVEQLTERIGFIGSAAQEAGISGKAGFETIAGMLNFGSEGAKNFRKNLTTVSGIIEELGSKTKRNKMMMQLGVDGGAASKATDFQSAIAEMLKKTGGKKEKLAVAFANASQLEFMVGLGQHYNEAFTATKGDMKTKMAAGVAEFRRQLAESGKSAISGADLTKIASERMKDAPATMEQAMAKMKQAFDRPEIIAAVGRLADSLPMLAEAAAKAVGFMVAHPLASGAAVVGAVAAKGAAGAVLPGLIQAAFSTGGTLAAGSITAAAPSIGAQLGTGLAGVAPGIGAAIATGLASAGALAAVGAALYQAYQLESELKEKDVVDSTGKKVKQSGPKRKSSPWDDLKREFKHDIGYTTDEDYFNDYASEHGVITSGEQGNFGHSKKWQKENMGALGSHNFSQGSYEEYAARQGINLGPPRVANEDAFRKIPMKEHVTVAPGPPVAESLQALIERMGGELKVRVVNPQDIGGNSSGNPGTPGPGTVTPPGSGHH